MFENLTAVENSIIEMFLQPEFSFKEQLIQQLHHAFVKRTVYENAYYVDFNVDRACPEIMVDLRVPISILVDHSDPHNDTAVYLQDLCSFSPLDGHTSPTGFFVHIKDGFLIELEVFTLSGEKLDFDTMLSGRRHYVIMEETLWQR